MGWVYLSHPDSTAAAVRFPDDAAVLDAQYARGWEQADDPDDPGPPPAGAAVEPDEVDGRGQGWVVMRHAESGGQHSFPVEVVDDQRSRGWVPAAEAQAAALEEQKKADLQAEAEKRGLPKSGTKQELIDRLSEDDQAPVEPESEEQ